MTAVAFAHAPAAGRPPAGPVRIAAPRPDTEREGASLSTHPSRSPARLTTAHRLSAAQIAALHLDAKRESAP